MGLCRSETVESDLRVEGQEPSLGQTHREGGNPGDSTEAWLWERSESKELAYRAGSHARLSAAQCGAQGTVCSPVRPGTEGVTRADL